MGWWSPEICVPVTFAHNWLLIDPIVYLQESKLRVHAGLGEGNEI